MRLLALTIPGNYGNLGIIGAVYFTGVNLGSCLPKPFPPPLVGETACASTQALEARGRGKMRAQKSPGDEPGLRVAGGGKG